LVAVREILAAPNRYEYFLSDSCFCAIDLQALFYVDVLITDVQKKGRVAPFL